MLVNKGYSVNDVVSFKIMNGDEIVGKVVEERGDSFVVAQPMTVVPQQKGIGLMQSMFSVDPKSEFTISKSHIMLQCKTADQLADHYRELTTGIKTVRNESRIIV
jgi:hypothetical protein